MPERLRNTNRNLRTMLAPRIDEMRAAEGLPLAHNSRLI